MKPKDPFKPSFRYLVLADRLLFAGCGAILALLFYFTLYSTIPTNPSTPTPVKPSTVSDPPAATFYDDPSVSYTIEKPITNWDEKRLQWLAHHPWFSSDRVLMVTGSAPEACHNSGGDHLLLRFFKNKVDYCRIHGYDIFYNTALLHHSMPGAWAKIPTLRAVMVAHPEAEWIWWVDSDAAFTDIEFTPPFHLYHPYNLIVPGWPDMVYAYKSWVGLNAGVFMLRNCQWSLDFLSSWADMAPVSPNYKRFEKQMQEQLADRVAGTDSEDQSALVLLLLNERKRLGDKVMIENEYDLHGYWRPLVPRLPNVTELYKGMEQRTTALRRRRAEKVTAAYGKMRQTLLENEVKDEQERRERRRPFVMHFTGCMPCVGGHNPAYSSETCIKGMHSTLDFADDQVLRAYGFGRSSDGHAGVLPLPFVGNGSTVPS